MEVCERNSCVCGYHIYKDIWDTVIGEELRCEREPDNGSDRYAVAIKIIIGHMPRKISQACSLFLRRGNEITCCVTGHTRRYSVNLPHGGLEIPCVLRFEGETKEIANLRLRYYVKRRKQL